MNCKEKTYYEQFWENIPDTDVATIQKIVSFYTLITASMMMISSKLQDIIGKRTIFLTCHNRRL